MTKREWKKQVKEKIKHVEQRSKEKETSMKKLKPQKGGQFNRKEYLKRMGLKISREVPKRKLEMTDIENNYGQRKMCICGSAETAEHIVECRKVMKEMGRGIEKEWLKETVNTEKIGRTTENGSDARVIEWRDQRESAQQKEKRKEQ